MDKAEVKKILQIKTTTHDEYFDIMIPLLIDWARDYTNNKFEDTSQPTSSLPGGVQIFIAKACEYNMIKAGINSRTMGEVSYTYELDFPPSIMKYLRPYKRLRFI